jgi:hypothetical protein
LQQRISSAQVELADGGALLRVAVLAPPNVEERFCRRLQRAYVCQTHLEEERVEPNFVAPSGRDERQGLIQAVEYLLPPAATSEREGSQTRWPWLCGLRHAALVFRPPILVPPEHAGLRFAVPPALDDALAGAKTIHVARGVYVEKGASLGAAQLHIDLRDEHVSGDKVSGDKIAGDRFGGDKVGGDQIVAGDKSVTSGKEHTQVSEAASPPAGPAVQLHCPNCGRIADRSARFCSGCGSTLPRLCPACGNAAQAADRFCSECGQPLGDKTGPSGGSQGTR